MSEPIKLNEARVKELLLELYRNTTEGSAECIAASAQKNARGLTRICFTFNGPINTRVKPWTE